MAVLPRCRNVLKAIPDPKHRTLHSHSWIPLTAVPGIACPVIFCPVQEGEVKQTEFLPVLLSDGTQTTLPVEDQGGDIPIIIPDPWTGISDIGITGLSPPTPEDS